MPVARTDGRRMSRAGAPPVAARVSTARVLLSVAACFAVVEALLLRLAEGGRLDLVRVGIAAAASTGLSRLGHHVALSGFSVATNAGLVTVAVGCLPIVHVSLTVALFGFGVSSPLRRRLLWMTALIAVALALEVARIMIVTVLFDAGSASLEYVHLTVMPALTLAVVVCSWLYEMKAGARV